MSHSESSQQDSFIHRQVFKSLQKLTFYFDRLTNPELIENCHIWKHDKGIKRLIALAVQGDKFLHRQSNSFAKMRATQNAQRKKKVILKPVKLKRRLRNRYRQIIAEDQQNEESSQNPPKPCQANPEKCSAPKPEPSEPRTPIIKQEPIIKIQTSPTKKSPQVKKQHTFSVNLKSAKQEEDSIFYSDSNSNSVNANSHLDYNSIDGENKLKEEIQLMGQAKKRKSYMRGPYKNYTREMKQQMVDLYNSTAYSISKISSMYEVPIKNIKRWAENGVDRKQGAGRKRLDPNMEDQLCNQIKNKFQPNTIIEYSEVRALALNLSKVRYFKASKGWIMSFVQRYELDKIYKIS